MVALVLPALHFLPLRSSCHDSCTKEHRQCRRALHRQLVTASLASFAPSNTCSWSSPNKSCLVKLNCSCRFIGV